MEAACSHDVLGMCGDFVLLLSRVIFAFLFALLGHAVIDVLFLFSLFMSLGDLRICLAVRGRGLGFFF